MSIVFLKPSHNKSWAARMDTENPTEWLRVDSKEAKVCRDSKRRGIGQEYIDNGSWQVISEEEAYAIFPEFREFVERYLVPPDRPATLVGDHW